MPDLAGAGALCPIVHRVHALAWRPGAHLHDAWWRKLDLDGWQDDYRTHAGCRRALDALIVQRRGFPVAPLPAAMTEAQARLIALEPRLPALLVALGFYTLRTPELLLLGDYRRALAAVLGEPACDQLAMLVPGAGGGPIAGTPDRFHAHLLELGCAWMQRDLGACPAWQALAIRFPPSDPQPRLIPEQSPLSLLFRMERFL